MTHEALLHAIIENPDDDAPRLAYADWCDQHGQPERAGFIRIQCQLGRLPERNPQRRGLEERERWLLRKYKRPWLGELNRLVEHGWFERGFVGAVRLAAERFFGEGDNI